MKKSEIENIKEHVALIFCNTKPENKYYEDFKWFSNINYTTTTEYLGELTWTTDNCITLHSHNGNIYKIEI